MIVLHIENSYSTWLPHTMKKKIQEASKLECGLTNAAFYLNRTYCSMYVEWWLHNIGYYLTLPFNKLEEINIRCKHVDLERWD